GVVGIQRVDTRALTLRLRDHGAMMGIVSDELTEAEMRSALAAAEPIEARDLVAHVSTRAPYVWTEGAWRLGEGFPVHRPEDLPYHVVAYDFGIKRNILRLLVEAGSRVEVVPHDTPASE